MGLPLLPLNHSSPFWPGLQSKLKRDGILYGPDWHSVERKKKNHTGREMTVLSYTLNSIKGIEKRHSLVVLFPKEIKPTYSPYFLRFHSCYL